MIQGLRIGVLADTHIPYRLDGLPAVVERIFAGADLILHAGDLDETDVLVELGRIAPTVAVRGNWHLHPPNRGSPHLPATVHMHLLGQHVVLNHGMWNLGHGVLLEVYTRVLGRHDQLNEVMIRGLHRRFRHADVVVFGHTHHAEVKRVGRTLFVNPGAV
ncbi:MAG: metallophosphoesterase family protein, partial [Chloroflexota bacterium]|nr:metallophosphoesterase family protein [Chloroflexota bacterium]